jgi:hypothetical protein
MQARSDAPYRERIQKKRVAMVGRFPAEFAACTAAATPSPTCRRRGRAFDGPWCSNQSRANCDLAANRVASVCLRLRRDLAPPPAVPGFRARVAPSPASSNRFDQVQPEVCGLAAAHLRRAF